MVKSKKLNEAYHEYIFAIHEIERSGREGVRIYEILCMAIFFKICDFYLD